MITVQDVVFDYPSSRALHGVGFEVPSGVVLALVGPNGAGKSTLMRCMAALETPTEGRIAVAGLDTQEDPRGVHALLGYLPDFFGLYDELTVRQSLTYAARSRGVEAARTAQAVETAAARVQLHDRLGARAGELSRGLRQRLAIAQTIVHAPRVLLLDEPTAGLDPIGAAQFDQLILTLRDALGLSVFLVTHDLDTLYTITDRVAVLSQKRVLVAAPIAEVEDYDDPRIHDYFHGPRGRAAYEAATQLKEQ